MKRKFTTYLFISAVLAAGAVQVFGQNGGLPNRPQNSSQNNNRSQLDFTNGNRRADGSQYSATPVQTSPGPSVPVQGWPIHGPQKFNIVTKEGTIERIEKTPGERLSNEEQDQISESRQKIQNAVTQIRSFDVDEAKRKDAKELIAKYLKVEFQADQESRREHVERLEKQVEQLKKQLTKREESQGKLIELRMQLLENDASGLSFPDSWGNLSGPTPPFYASAYPGGYVVPYLGDPGVLPQYVNPPHPPNSSPKIAPAATGQNYFGR
ncbi:MAG TPA: hypothetical protein VM260_25640 [Pirellula sp.]|nr:hypothetical protein [Pirellula sp.]